MTTWFRRLADVPHIGYTGSPDVNRKRLSGHDAVPKVHVSTFDRKRHESLWWRTREGESSASPAQSWTTEPRKGEAPAQTALRQLYERLELPGDINDYHFAIQDCYSTLWSHRRDFPWVLPTIEQLCLLDLRLVEAYPKAFWYEQAHAQGYYRIVAFEYLIRLYEREGYLYEALEVAKRASRLAQDTGSPAAIEALEKRIAQLEAEHAG